MADFQSQLQHLLANRRSEEARAFQLQVLKYVENRARRLRSQRYLNLLTESDLEETVSEVGLKLMTGALVRFRGNSLPELYAYVRTITDRSVGRAVRRKLRERDAIISFDRDCSRSMLGSLPAPDDNAEVVASCPLSSKDQRYLTALMQAGSKAEYARRAGQSRAAVTRMVQRIRGRISELEADQRMATDVWLHQKAREVLESAEPLAASC